MVSRISHGAPRATSPAGSPAGPGPECRRRSTVSRRLAWPRTATGRVTRTSPWLSTTSEAGSILAYDGYGKDVFDLFFRQLTRRSGGASIWIVTGDGARRIDSCVHEWCPNAERVPDGFHIVSWMADALGKISRRLWNQARGNGDDEAARRMRGVRYAVLKNPDRLAGRQDESPTALRNTDPRGRLYRARQLKELLRGLLGHPIGQAEDELKHWVFRASRSRIPEIVESARKIRRRRPDILRTIGSGYPNARLEAFNNRIKVTIRMAYGFHHVTNLIALVMLRCGGLDIRLPQPAI